MCGERGFNDLFQSPLAFNVSEAVGREAPEFPLASLFLILLHSVFYVYIFLFILLLYKISYLCVYIRCKYVSIETEWNSIKLKFTPQYIYIYIYLKQLKEAFELAVKSEYNNGNRKVLHNTRSLVLKLGQWSRNALLPTIYNIPQTISLW